MPLDSSVTEMTSEAHHAMGSKPHAKSNVQSQRAIQETETEKHDRAHHAVTVHLRLELHK